MRIALVYDYLPAQLGGAERVLPDIIKVFAGTIDLYLAGFVESEQSRALLNKIRHIDPQCKITIHSNISFLKGARLRLLHYRLPNIMQKFRFKEYSHVLCYTSFLAHTVIIPEHAKKIIYFNTPSRVLWNLQHSTSFIKRFIPTVIMEYLRAKLRRHDFKGVMTADTIITISESVNRRIQSFYNRKALTVYPAVDTTVLTDLSPILLNKGYFLHVSRLESYKNIDLLIRTAQNFPEHNFIIVGDGPYKQELIKLAQKVQKKTSVQREFLGIQAEHVGNIIFTGHIEESSKNELIAGSIATLSLNDEDFGLTKIESFVLGTPVVALAEGAAIELLQDTPGGILFMESTVDALSQALRQAVSTKWEREDIKQLAKPFSFDLFATHLRQALNA